jgi:hypothetical protein
MIIYVKMNDLELLNTFDDNFRFLDTILFDV